MIELRLTEPEKRTTQIHKLDVEMSEIDNVIIFQIPIEHIHIFQEQQNHIKEIFGPGKTIIMLPKDWEIGIYKLAGVELPAEEEKKGVKNI